MNCMALSALMDVLLVVPDHASQRGNHQYLRRLERRGKRLLTLNPENVRRRATKQSDGWMYDTLCDGWAAFLASFFYMDTILMSQNVCTLFRLAPYL
jgi:hypothetical protein